MADNNTSTDSLAAREVDFVTQYNKVWDELREVLGITRPIRKQPGAQLVAVRADVTLAESVGAGQSIEDSNVTLVPVHKHDLTVEKYATSTTIEDVAKYGAELAVEKTDEAFRNKLTSVVLERLYAYMQEGELRGYFDTYQMAVAMAIGLVVDKFKKLRMSIDGVNVFVNTLDAYRYLGAAELTVQSKFGMQYVENFMGAKKVFLASDIPEGKVCATADKNIDLYYVDPGDSDFAKLGTVYTVASAKGAQTNDEPAPNLIGFHAEGNYRKASGESYAIMGMELWAEYIDGVSVVTVGERPDTTLSALTVGSLALTPTFAAGTHEYAVTTSNSSNAVTATANGTGATVEITVNGAAHTSGGSATWEDGENEVKVVVTNGDESETYTVTVTKSS